MNIKKAIYLIVFIIFIIFVWYFRLDTHISIINIRQHANQLKQYTQLHYWRALCMYCVLFIAATIAAIPITAALTVLAGFLFGIFWGSVYAILSATLGAIILFISVRYLFAQWIQKKYAFYLQSLNKNIAQNGAKYLLIAQWIPFTPTPIINICAGLLVISLWTFIWTTMLGILPGTMIFTIIGSYLA